MERLKDGSISFYHTIFRLEVYSGRPVIFIRHDDIAADLSRRDSLVRDLTAEKHVPQEHDVKAIYKQRIRDILRRIIRDQVLYPPDLIAGRREIDELLSEFIKYKPEKGVEDLDKQ